MRLLSAALSLICLSTSMSSAEDQAERKRIIGKPIANRDADEADQALQDARAFRKKGEFAKALERHEWYHANALRINPAQYGVRLSFALSDWLVLGNQYPPALASLKRIRDEGTKTLEEGKGTPGLFHDVVSINERLSEDDANLALFKKLDTVHPELAQKSFRIISPTLLEKDEIALYTKYVGDFKTYLAREIENFNQMSVELRKRASPTTEQSIGRFKSKLIGLTLTLAKLATDKGDPALAAELKAMTAKSVPDPRLEK